MPVRERRLFIIYRELIHLSAKENGVDVPEGFEVKRLLKIFDVEV
jgi:hypothetical protein|tara:strand:+ start:237 stop:371 length:135 start_codon:yes stop_codon:yes gene_type:complete